MLVARLSYCGFHPSVARARSEAAMICAGSPGRRGAILTLKSHGAMAQLGPGEQASNSLQIAIMVATSAAPSVGGDRTMGVGGRDRPSSGILQQVPVVTADERFVRIRADSARFVPERFR